METAPKEKNKSSQISSVVDFVREQIGINLEKYRDETTRRFDKRGMITVDYQSMPKNEQRSLELLAVQYGGSLEISRSGTWMAHIRRLKKK